MMKIIVDWDTSEPYYCEYGFEPTLQERLDELQRAIALPSVVDVPDNCCEWAAENIGECKGAPNCECVAEWLLEEYGFLVNDWEPVTEETLATTGAESK